MNDPKESLNNTLVALAPHKYPKWILAFTGLILTAVIYSALLLPPYLFAAKIMKKGDEAFKSKNYQEAALFYTDVLNLQSSSLKAKISLAGIRAILSNNEKKRAK